MLSVPVEVQEALRTHQKSRLYGVAKYQRQSAELKIQPTGSLSFQADAEIQATGNINVVGFGNPLLPTKRTDLLAANGQEVQLFRELILHNGVYQIPLGVYRIVSNDGGTATYRPSTIPEPKNSPRAMYSTPDGYVAIPAWLAPEEDGYSLSGFAITPDGYVEYEQARVAGRAPTTATVLGWRVGLQLADRLRVIQRDKLLVEQTSPPAGATIYSELQRLSPIPVQVSPLIPDKTVPASLVYEDRPKAIELLAEHAGAVPHMTRQGALTLRPRDVWLFQTTPDFEITGTIPGTWQDGQTDDFVNFVRAASDDDRFVGFAQIADDSDPLSVKRAGRVTYEYKSPLITSQDAAASAAETTLRRLRNTRSRLVSVECTPEALLLELGDFGLIRDPINGRAVLGEVASMSIPLSPTGTVGVELIVAEEY